MTRQELSLGQPPEDPTRLRDFPRSKLEPEALLYRVTKKGRGPWWFNSSGSGRFDLPEPEGTCYLATDAVAALLEIIGPDREGGLVSAELLAERNLHELRVPESRSLADLTDRRAVAFGMTLEIHSLPTYELTQSWAGSLSNAGAQGLRYFARHDPAAGCSIALFGPAGERDWERGDEHGLEDREWAEQLWFACHIRVVSRPYSSQISILD